MKNILTKYQEADFKAWMEDGNVTKVGDNKYLEQTTQYRKEFTLDELKAFFKREFLSDRYATGGVSESHENNRMLRNQINEANHHSKELNSVVSGTTPVEPWVVAKMERATTDLSDVTHYLDGEAKMTNNPEKMAKGKKLQPGKVPRWWNKLVREYEYFVFNTRSNKVWAGNEYENDAKDELKEFLIDNPELPLKVLTKRAITNKKINPLAYESWARSGEQFAEIRGEELPSVVTETQESVFIEPYRKKFVLISVQHKNQSNPGLRRWANEFFTSKQEAMEFANQNNLKVVAKFDEGGLTIDDMDRHKVMNYLANKYPDYTNDNDWTEGDDDYFDEIFYTMVDDLRERYNLPSEYSDKANDLVEDYMQSNRDVMGLETMATGGKFAEGGMVGDEVVFNRWGDKAMGEITEILEDGTYIVHSGMSSRSVDPREIIEVKKKKKFLGLFDQGGTTDFTNLPLGTRINAYYERRDKDLKGKIIEKTPTGYKIETHQYDSFPVTYDMITRVMSLPTPVEPEQTRKRFLGLFDKGGSTSPEIHILDKGVKYDKAMYKGVFSDYDNDGLENLDDPNPTITGDKVSVEERRITESIAQLLNIKEDLDSTMYKAVNDIAKISPKDAVIYARTKTPYSIIQKLIKKRLLTPKDPKKGLTDLIGMTIVVDSYADILKLRKFIESGKKFEVYETEDFYENPLDGYMAIHYILIFKDDKGSLPVELQLKTKRMKAINQISHKAYAQGNLDKDALLNATSLANKADKGDKEAIKSFELMMQYPEAVELSFFKDKAKKYDTGGEIDDNEKEEWTEAGNVRNFGWFQDFKKQSTRGGGKIVPAENYGWKVKYYNPTDPAFDVEYSKDDYIIRIVGGGDYEDYSVSITKGDFNENAMNFVDLQSANKFIIDYMGNGSYSPHKKYAGGGFFMDKNDPMFTIEEIGRLAGLRPIAVAEWGDKNNIDLMLVLKDLKARKITGIDLMGAVVGTGRDKRSKQIIADYSKVKYAGGGITWVRGIDKRTDNFLDIFETLDKVKHNELKPIINKLVLSVQDRTLSNQNNNIFVPLLDDAVYKEWYQLGLKRGHLMIPYSEFKEMLQSKGVSNIHSKEIFNGVLDNVKDYNGEDLIDLNLVDGKALDYLKKLQKENAINKLETMFSNKPKFSPGGTTQSMFSEMPDAGLYEMLNILIKESGSDKEKNKEAISDITAEIKRRQSPKFAPGGKTDPEFQYNYEVVLSKIDKDGNWHEFERKSFGDDYSSVLLYANKMNKEGIGVDVLENGQDRGWSTNNGMHYFAPGGSTDLKDEYKLKPYKILSDENPKPLIVNDNQVSMFETIEKPVKLHPRTKQPMSNSVPEVDIVIKRTIPFNERPKVTNSKSATEIFRKFWDTDRINIQESFWIMLLDRANNVIGIYNPSKGGIAATIVDGGLIGATALKSLAQAVIVCHNHPSGNLKFSQADKNMTKKLGTTLKVLDITLLDSMVITETEYNSMADNSELPDFD